MECNPSTTSGEEQKQENSGKIAMAKEIIRMLSNGSIEIPPPIREGLGIRAWDDLEFTIEGDTIVIAKVATTRAAEPRSCYIGGKIQDSAHVVRDEEMY
ncbi:MAG TPA: AbrB/MazE/SpoVT family DNA-binding domain-containing protein [Firmicutes bacterium]|nr:AbrB/MazE/SpoVT family DNA-binding domain-containing protein [Bacillota bacterium]